MPWFADGTDDGSFSGRGELDGNAAVWFYAFMRTTVVLPSDLLRQAKARAASRGEPLKALLTRAVASEVGRSLDLGETGARVRLPLFGDPGKGRVDVSAARIASALAEDDAAGATRAAQRRRK